ncbi:MAG: hypothetical protein FJY95_03385 [Candidatus Handelsmanbacteria bacterium]|nr:hypothetical protein [Candidatus Handelsmanbacteria bacterium]
MSELPADPSCCIVRLGRGERIGESLAGLLKPMDARTMHQYRLPADAQVELHYHDCDEYWLFAEGRPLITLRSPAGVKKEYPLEPGDMVACVRGVEHTLWADHELVYFQWISVLEGHERPGHLRR